MVPIPWRQINSKFQTVLFARFRDLLYHIAFAIFERTVLHGVLSELTRPQAKAIVMLAGKYGPFEASILECGDPLVGVKCGRVKDGRAFVAKTPFQIGKCVGCKMYKSILLHLMP